MKLYTPFGTTGSGISTRETLQNEFTDIVYESHQDDEKSRINNKFITTIREVALQNGIDSYKRSGKSSPLHLKITREEANLNAIPYFVNLKSEIENGITKLKTQGELTESKKEKVGLLEEWLSNFGIVKILKIEDNGKGLSGNGRQGDFDTCGTRAILGDGESDKGEGSGGSFGKGAKTAFYLSQLNTVFYESAHEDDEVGGFKKLSLGHSFFPTFDNADGQIIGDPVFAVCSKQNDNHAGIPTWHEGSLPKPLNRTLTDESGLTISSIGVDIPDNWIDQTCFAIVTSHLGILLDENLEWEIQIGSDIKLNIENLLDTVIALGNKEFITKGGFNVRIQYQMSLSWIKKELEKVDFEPFDIKVGRKTLTIEGHFLFGENSKIQELCSFEDLENNKNPYLNHFLFVREGMIIRTSEVQHKKGELFKLNPNEGKYFGYVFMNKAFCDIMRHAENPSHDKLNSQRLDNKKDENIPKKGDFNKALQKINRQLLEFIENWQGDKGERAKLDLFNTPGENEESLYNSPLVDISVEFVTKKLKKTKSELSVIGSEEDVEYGIGDEEVGSRGVVGGEGQTNPSPGPNEGSEEGSASPVNGQANSFIAFKSFTFLEEFQDFNLTASILCKSSSNIEFSKFYLCECMDREGKDLTDLLFVTKKIMVDNKEVNYEQKNIKVKGKTIKCVSIDYMPNEQKTIEFRVECTSKLKSVPNFLILASNE